MLLADVDADDEAVAPAPVGVDVDGWAAIVEGMCRVPNRNGNATGASWCRKRADWPEVDLRACCGRCQLAMPPKSDQEVQGGFCYVYGSLLLRVGVGREGWCQVANAPNVSRTCFCWELPVQKRQSDPVLLAGADHYQAFRGRELQLPFASKIHWSR